VGFENHTDDVSGLDRSNVEGAAGQKISSSPEHLKTSFSHDAGVPYFLNETTRGCERRQI